MYSNDEDAFEKMSPEEQDRRMEIVRKEAIDTVCDLMDIIDSADCKTIEEYQSVFAAIKNRIDITDLRFYNYLTSYSSRDS